MLEQVTECRYCGSSMYRMDCNMEPGEDGRRLVCASTECWGEVTEDQGELVWEC